MKAVSKKQRGNLQKQLDEIVTSVNEEATIIKVRDTVITAVQTNSSLNTKYPDAGIFSEVFAPNITGGGMRYTKVSATLWVSSPSTQLA